MGIHNESIIIKCAFDNTEVTQGMLQMQAKVEMAHAKMNAISAEYDRQEQAAHLASVEKMIAADDELYAARVAAIKLADAAETASIAKRESEYLQFVESSIVADQEKDAEYLAGVERMIAADMEKQAIDDEIQSKSWAKYQAFTANKIALDKAWMENYAAQRAIAEGSGGFGNMPGAEVGAGLIGGTAEKVAEGSLTVMSREAMVMVREGLRGNWSRMLGSLTIFLSAMGGQVQKFIQGLFGMTGLLLGAALTGAYLLYEDIKGFNKQLDAMQKENAESIGNTAKAVKEATDKGISGAVSFEAHIRSLADAHETLAHWVQTVVKAINEQSAAEAKLIAARGNQQLAAINLAEHMGMISHEQAAGARTASEVATFSAMEASKIGAISDEGTALFSTRREALRRSRLLESAGRAAEYAVKGVDANGNIVNQAAFDRNKRMRERENIQKDIDTRQKRVDDSNSGSDLEHWAGDALDPLHKSKVALSAADEEIIAKEKALLAKREKQAENNISAQKAAEEAYKQAVKAIDENAASLKSVNEQIEAFGTKYKDAKTAMAVLHSSLVAQQNKNTAAEYELVESSDRVTPTIEMLAGRGYMEKLEKLYGKGGQYDLEAGNGYLSGYARDYELAQKQQMYALEYEQGQYDPETRKLIEGSDAWNAQRRATADRNMLGVAGIETEAMKMQDMVDNGNTLVAEIRALNKLIADGIPIVDGPVGSTGGQGGK